MALEPNYVKQLRSKLYIYCFIAFLSLTPIVNFSSIPYLKLDYLGQTALQ